MSAGTRIFLSSVSYIIVELLVQYVVNYFESSVDFIQFLKEPTGKFTVVRREFGSTRDTDHTLFVCVCVLSLRDMTLPGGSNLMQYRLVRW